MNVESIKNNCIKAIMQYAIPSMIAMVLTSMITITDGYFVGNYIGRDGTAAINLGLPIVYLYLGIGLMLSVGGVSISGRLYGAGDIKKADSVFRQITVLMIGVLVILTVILQLLFIPVRNVYQRRRKTGLLYEDKHTECLHKYSSRCGIY